MSSSANPSKLSEDEALYFARHLFLPPKLPQASDETTALNSRLVLMVENSLNKFKQHCSESQIEAIDDTCKLIGNLKTVHGFDRKKISEEANESSLLNCLGALSNAGGNVAVHVKAQNAGVMISKKGHEVHFESFELSPLNAAVYSGRSRLRRTFPGVAVAINEDEFQQDGFQNTVAQTLSELSHQIIDGMQPQTRKANAKHDEIRDTTDPAMVTEVFTGFLAAIGKPAAVKSISKNTREEVLWQNAKLPWRRSPLWLMIRVLLQLSLSRNHDDPLASHDLYKNFMIFLLAGVLGDAKKLLPCDLLHCMNAKLARRLLKLGSRAKFSVVKIAENSMMDVHSLIKQTWLQIHKSENAGMTHSQISSLAFENDTYVKLPGLETFIDARLNRARNSKKGSFIPTSTLARFTPEHLPKFNTLLNGEQSQTRFNLFAFENWVSSNLPQWITRHLQNADTCASLADLMERYHITAHSLYSGNPEAISVMLLTILELWIACDKSAISIHPLLSSYNHDLPISKLENLLLPTKDQMCRLDAVERYLSKRSDAAKHSSTAVFVDIAHPESFAVKFFEQSKVHTDLRSRIDRDARNNKQQKLDELRNLQQKYNALIIRSRGLDCEYHEVRVNRHFTEKRHYAGSCEKCRVAQQAADMTVDIFEWPLPNDELRARAIVFELALPMEFAAWREATLFLTLEVLKGNHTHAPPQYVQWLYADKHLCQYVNPQLAWTTSRFRLLSNKKLVALSHYNKKPVSTAESSSVCVDNGAHYLAFDATRNTFLSNIAFGDAIPLACTLNVSTPLLQPYLLRPAESPNGPPNNMVVAAQSECPASMTLNEFNELCPMPHGVRTQWDNCAVQLRTPSIDLEKSDTAAFISQCIYQVGPRSTVAPVLRTGHGRVAEEGFAKCLLGYLNETLRRVQAKWESAYAFDLLIRIAVRILTLTPSSHIRSSCIEYLQQARCVVYNWVQALQDKALASEVPDERIQYTKESVQLALICASSLDVDSISLKKIMDDQEQASIYVHCIIIMREGDHTIPYNDPWVTPRCLRFDRLVYRCYPLISSRLAAVSTGISKSWSGFQTTASWHQVSEECDHWLFTKMNDEMDVHFNTLSGELLVNGSPLNRLPKEYEECKSYRTLFGRCAIEVLPSSVPGMIFTAKKHFSGWSLNFGMDSSGTMLVQASNDQGTWELVPSSLFNDAFPEAFSKHHVHWFNTDTEKIDFCPIEEPWGTSEWILSNHDRHGLWVLAKGGASMVGCGSRSASVICQLLSPLAEPRHIHLTVQDTVDVEVSIPALQLSFRVDKRNHALWSNEFRGEKIDSNQTLGTLIGFRNRLLLQHEDGAGQRLLLIEGPVSYKANAGHIAVSCDVSSAPRLHSYRVDKRLKRLEDNHSLQSKLFLAFIHALTSFCLPDPFTQRTGTEQALSILRSAAVFSFPQWDKHNAKILEKIAELTPQREYYPSHLASMQMISWQATLSCLSQSGYLRQAVSDLKGYLDRCSMFHSTSHEVATLPRTNVDLLERELIRSSGSCVAKFGADPDSSQSDTAYTSRDSANGTNFDVAYMTSSFALRRSSILLHALPSNPATHLLSILRDAGDVKGNIGAFDSASVQFDARVTRPTIKQTLAEDFVALQQLFCRHDAVDQHQAALWLTALDASGNIDRTMLQIFVVSRFTHHLHSISPPTGTIFTLGEGIRADKVKIESMVRSKLVDISCTPEMEIRPLKDENSKDYERRRDAEFRKKQSSAVDTIVNNLYGQPLSPAPLTPELPGNLHLYIDMPAVMKVVTRQFAMWTANKGYMRFLTDICQVMSSLKAQSISAPVWPQSKPIPESCKATRSVSVRDIFDNPAPELQGLALSIITMHDVNDLAIPREAQKTGIQRLDLLLKRPELSETPSKYESDYITDLSTSLKSLETKSRFTFKRASVRKVIIDSIKTNERHLLKIYRHLVEHIEKFTFSKIVNSKQAKAVQHWPRLSPVFFLEQLSRSRWTSLSGPWRECLIKFGEVIVALLRAERLLKLSDYGSYEELTKEMENPPHMNWDPREFPDSLLLEIEGNFTIRRVQEDISQRMRNPDGNSVMQLNMGEGKTLVIIPNVASGLARGEQIVRVIVAKPQSKQMQRMLISKMGGLLNRKIYHMPFSRALKLDVAASTNILRICKDCVNTGGILLMQPEHIMSLQLMCLDAFVSGRIDVGKALSKVLDFFDQYSRDLIDESDDILSPRFELVYTEGLQQAMEHSPERWTCIQHILDLVERFAPDIQKVRPESVEIIKQKQGFPRIRLLGQDAEKLLLERMVQSFCEEGLPGFPLHSQPDRTRNLLATYITKYSLGSDERELIESSAGGFFSGDFKLTLLLLRGLFACGLLGFVFREKRWRVNYGLTPSRLPPTQLAVPFTSKDTPSPRSEFSHPDVVITLTCLSYYYGGLTDEDLVAAFQCLLLSDQKDQEYSAWVKNAPGLPESMRTLGGVSLRDKHQCTSILFKELRFSKGAIDYFLSALVFPKQMRDFPEKLTASAWDMAKTKSKPTAGFSGTNDSRITLPLSIHHVDLPDQMHTNALVLSNLLVAENLVALVPSGTDGSDADRLLSTVMSLQPSVQVILDVGAQILELNNLEVATKWLAMSPSKQATVFVNSDDEISVVNRAGRVELLHTSSYVAQLDVCLVFLDESHTRGIDLRLPTDYRAAVTLGAKLTKDRLVQACMRMRKLACGQSLTFCIPQEIQDKIQRCTKKPVDAAIEVSDILHWSITETFSDSQKSIPLWATAGQRFVTHKEHWNAARPRQITELTQNISEEFLEEERLSLETRYGARTNLDLLEQLRASSHADLQHIARKCKEFKNIDFNQSTLHEEQERELSPELEREREIQKPEPAKAENHTLHKAVVNFWRDSILEKNPAAFMPAFHSLRSIRAARNFDVTQFASTAQYQLLATLDFARTVKRQSRADVMDSYQRPVRWILTKCTKDDIVTEMIIISHYEANALRGIQQKAGCKVTMHPYSPRWNLAFPSWDRLDTLLFPATAKPPRIPDTLVAQLCIIAGQLYFTSYEDYQETGRLLGLATEKAKPGWTVEVDNFIREDDQGRVGAGSGMRESPVAFLKALMTTVRRNGDGISKTHMGKFLNGEILRREEFE